MGLTISDGFAIGMMFYIIVMAFVVSQLPDNVYDGRTIGTDSLGGTVSFSDDRSAFVDANATVINPTSDADLGIIKKMFLTWDSDGIPAVIGIIIALINWACVVGIIIWGYNKVRGLS